MDARAFTRRARALATVSLIAVLATVGPALARTQAQAPVAVEATPLGELDLWSPGGRDTGLPPTLWADSSGDLARSVLEAIPTRPLSPAAVSLARRVLATGARAPAGLGDDAGAAATRLRALLALGDVDGAAAAIQRTPRIAESEPLSRIQAEVALLQGREEAACETGRALRPDRDGLWWLKLRAQCHLIAREPGAAQVTLDLWRQQGGKDAAADRMLTAAIVGAEPSGAGSAVDPLTFQLSRRMGRDVPLAEAPAWALATLASTPSGLVRSRAAAAYRALRMDALPVEAVRRIYAIQAGETAPAARADGGPAGEPTIVLPTGDLATFAADAGPNGEAALYTLAAAAPEAGVRQAAALALLRRAKVPGEFAALARLISPSLAEIAAGGGALEDPVLFATAAAAAQDAATAARIRATIEQDTVAGSSATDLALLDSLIVAAGAEGAGPTLDRLIERSAAGDARLRARAQGAALLVSALGARASPQARAQFAAFDIPQGKATAARLQALQLAADGGAMGDVALYVLSIAQQQGLAVALADRAHMVQALRRAGLEGEARAFAIEGLLGLIGR